MAPRTQFLVQLLQKMGAPLMGAINAHSDGADDGQKDASAMAALLSESVKSGIALSQSMNLKTDDGDADAIRVALASLSAQLIADTYKNTGRLPNENDSRRLAKALESVIVFADNFAPANEHMQRLQTLEGTPPFFDPVQTSIYSIHALLPVISALGEFSFGQSETRLLQDVAERLSAKSKELQQKFSPDSGKMGELMVLQALAQIYAACHRAETKRLHEAGDQGGGEVSMEGVWSALEKDVSMIDVLMVAMSGATVQSTGKSGGGVKPAVETPIEMPAPAAPPAAPPPASAPPAGGGSPMSFFKKK